MIDSIQDGRGADEPKSRLKAGREPGVSPDSVSDGGEADLRSKPATSTDYRRTFEARGSLYNRAMSRAPDARSKERRLLLERLSPRRGERIVDAPAGGGYVAEALAELGADVVCVEPASRFAEAIASRFTTLIRPLDDTGLADASVDKIGSLAGLHHLEQPQAFFDEARRVLKPGGVLAVADVLLPSDVAGWLNGPVDQLSETGHEGRFFPRGRFLEHLADAGFVQEEESQETFTWDFPDHTTMLAFCRDLFGLTRASPDAIERELLRSLPVSTDDDGVHLGWSLLYARGVRPG